MNNSFDLIVIGSGPGGYVAAIRAAQLGMKVACVEKSPTLGGTCLNIGCIPSKALLESSERYVETRSHLAQHGIHVDHVSLDLATMLARKDKIVSQLTSGIRGLFTKNHITHIQGIGRLGGSGRVDVTMADGSTQQVTAKNILIATGSVPTTIPGVDIDYDRLGTSTEALAYPTVPEHLIVIGAGVIGLELGSVWARLGAKVTVLEFQPALLPMMDQDVSKLANRLFSRQGLEFRFRARVQSASPHQDRVTITYIDEQEQKQQLEGDRVLVAVGRRPNTQNLGAKEIGLAMDPRGCIQVDNHYRSNIPGIWAIGDVIPGPMLAHKAEEEGIAAVEIMAGLPGHVNYQAIPNVIYTHPEIASVGQTEQELKQAQIPYHAGSFPFLANGRAKALGQTDGLVKILAHAQTDRILGVHCIGARASELIAEAALAIEFSASSEDIARSVHAHPTLSEIVKEAALAVGKRVIHI